jgi:hypothetical protein
LVSKKDGAASCNLIAIHVARHGENKSYCTDTNYTPELSTHNRENMLIFCQIHGIVVHEGEALKGLERS